MEARHWVLVVLVISVAALLLFLGLDGLHAVDRTGDVKVQIQLIKACTTLPLDARTVCLQTLGNM